MPGRAHLAVMCRNNGLGSGIARACAALGVGLQVGSPATKRLAGLQAEQVQQAGLKRGTPAARRRRKFCKGRRFKQHEQSAVTETYKNDSRNYRVK